MNHPSDNPYASPQGVDAASPLPPQSAELVPLWIWLTIALSVSFFAMPADPISMLVALIHGLIYFWMGIFAMAKMNIFLRLIPAALGTAAIVSWLLYSGRDFFVPIWIGYSLASAVFGAWTFRRIQHGRWSILVSFSVGYLLGSIGCFLGTIAGAVIGVQLAKRQLSISKKA